MASTTCTTIAGVFNTREAADRAIADLRKAGYEDDEIGMVWRDSSGKTVRSDGSGVKETNASEGAAVGAGVGALAGAGVGAAVWSGLIPVVGPVLAVGTIGTILLNAAGGAAVASLAGALIGSSIPEDDAKYYEGEVKAGRYLVTVECGQGDDARDVITRHGGYDRASAPAI
jgi:hypothetical protein